MTSPAARAAEHAAAPPEDVDARSLFTMHGAREVLTLSAGAMHIERQVAALETAVSNNPGLAFDLAKSLIETACKTILADRGESPSDRLDLPKLLKETLGRLRLVPESHAGTPETEASLRKTAGGLQTVIQGLCELRNAEGFASHGKDGHAEQLESVQAELVARAADTVVSFLFKTHRTYPAGTSERRMTFRDHDGFNEHIDENNELVQIFDLTYRPSEVLFEVDGAAYRDLLADFAADSAEEETPDGTGQPDVEGEATT